MVNVERYEEVVGHAATHSSNHYNTRIEELNRQIFRSNCETPAEYSRGGATSLLAQTFCCSRCRGCPEGVIKLSVPICLMASTRAGLASGTEIFILPNFYYYLCHAYGRDFTIPLGVAAWHTILFLNFHFVIIHSWSWFYDPIASQDWQLWVLYLCNCVRTHDFYSFISHASSIFEQLRQWR